MKRKKLLYSSHSDSILMPNLIQIEHKNLIMASFQLMKLMPAKYVIEKGIKEKRIDPKYPIIETSSGTYALGIGMVCAELGIPYCIVSDPAIDMDLQRRLEDLGGKVQILTQALSAENPQIFRLNTLKELLVETPGSFWPSQYNNPENLDAYSVFAEQLLENIGENFTLVGTVGSGGSTCGTMRYLRKINSNIQLVGVDTFGSILFGLKNGKRLLRGLGNSILPQNLHHDLFDQVHWIAANDAYAHTRRLHAKFGCFHGPTSGAAYQVANWLAKKNPEQTIVFIAPDMGYRYQSTVYNNTWLSDSGMSLSTVTPVPRKVTKPIEAIEPWSYMDWNRLSYETHASLSQ